jgi:hypothetical protein
MTGYVIEAPAKSRQEIRYMAELVRSFTEKLTGKSAPYFDVASVIEQVLLAIDPAFILEVLEVGVMGDTHGLTTPSQHTIQLRQDVYEGACRGKGRDRLTIAHEIGHYVLHDGLTLPRKIEKSKVPAYRDAEWQANCFAGELLVSARYAKECRNSFEVSEMFGVSDACAAIQYRVLKREGLIR